MSLGIKSSTYNEKQIGAKCSRHSVFTETFKIKYQRI